MAFFLTYDYLSLTEAEDQAFEAELAQHGLAWEVGQRLPDPLYHARVLKSWERIFEIDRAGDGDWWGAETRAEKMLQGTFWQLLLSQVREVTVFTSRGRGSGRSGY